MNLLLIDTCGVAGSIALADTTAVRAAATVPGRSASELLVSTIRDLIARAGLTLPSIEAIAIVHGPGSFTGVRVGVSAAKGLCEALGVPLIAISRLAVLANLADALSGTLVHALLDAGRGEFYSGEYRDGICLRESLVTRDELLAALKVESAPTIIACETMVAEALAAFAPRQIAEPTAADALPLVLPGLERKDCADLATLDANYLRRTDAEIFAKTHARIAAAAAAGRSSQ